MKKKKIKVKKEPEEYHHQLILSKLSIYLPYQKNYYDYIFFYRLTLHANNEKENTDVVQNSSLEAALNVWAKSAAATMMKIVSNYFVNNSTTNKIENAVDVEPGTDVEEKLQITNQKPSKPEKPNNSVMVSIKNLMTMFKKKVVNRLKIYVDLFF